jgi:zinc protease
MRRIVVALVALLALGSPGALAARPDLSLRPKLLPMPAWQAPAPTSATTDGGTRVLVLAEHAIPIVHVVVTIPAGSALDPHDREGLAAAVAMMLQEGGAGSRSAPALAQAFATLGVDLEARVDGDGVTLAFSVLARNLDRALALVGDMLARPRFDAVEWPRAQAQRINEIRRRLDEPGAIADDLFNAVVLGEHPYAHAPLGTIASVGAISVDELKRFYAAHYGPRCAAVILVGDVDPAGAAARVQRAFADWPATAVPPPALPPTTTPAARLVLVDRPGAPQSQIRVGHLGREGRTPDFAPLTLLGSVLGGPFTSRLNQNLREKHGFVYHARARFSLRRDGGTFAAIYGVRSDATAAALKETVAEIAGMRAPLPEAELDKGRSMMVQDLVEAFADGNQTAEELARLERFGLPLDFWSKLPATLAALDVPAVTRVAQQLFFPERLIVVVVGDRKLIEPSLRALPFVKTIELRNAEGKLVK